MIEPLSVITSVLPAASKLFTKQFLLELTQDKTNLKNEKIDELVSTLKLITRMQKVVVSATLSLLRIEDTVERARSQLHVIIGPQAASFPDQKETSKRLLADVKELAELELVRQVEEFAKQVRSDRQDKSLGYDMDQFLVTYKRVMKQVLNTLDALIGEVALVREGYEPEPQFHFVRGNLAKLSCMTKALIRQILLLYEDLLAKVEKGIV